MEPALVDDSGTSPVEMVRWVVSAVKADEVPADIEGAKPTDILRDPSDEAQLLF